MLTKVQAFTNEHHMIEKGDRIVVGVSGGADSVCLFHVLLQFIPQYELKLFVVHVNHGIRGMDANEDEEYVKKLCEQNVVFYQAVKKDVPMIAQRDGLSEEEAGRIVRYEAFADCMKKHQCNKIAIAHNMNDNAETFLFHLFRGSGIKGLTGIQAIRDFIIRPLLCVKREEIEVYLKENNISYRTDKTNFTMDYSRNKIRHHIISFAQKEINTKVIEHIANTTNHLNEINQYLDKNIRIAFNDIVMREANNKMILNIKLFKQEDLIIQKGIVRVMFLELAQKLKDIDALHIQLVIDLMEKEVGKMLNLPYEILALKGYDSIIMSIKDFVSDESIYDENRKHDYYEEQILIKPGEYYIPQTKQKLYVTIRNYKKNMIIPKNGCTKWFDYDKIKNTVLVRTRKEGDFIQIDAKGSNKKIKSLFIDEKVPREKRNLLPLIADGSHIMWVIGGRMSEAYKISDDTKTILEISIDGGK